MKRCKKYRDMFTGALYDELPGARRFALDQHLRDCPGCAAEYEKLAGVLDAMDRRSRPEMDPVFWESYWERLEEKMDPAEGEKKPARQAWSRRGLAIFSIDLRRFLVPAAAAALVVLGVFIGKYIYGPSGPIPAEEKKMTAAAVKHERPYPGLSRHFDNLKPYLLECANASPGSAGRAGDTIQVDRDALKQLVLENYLLKRAAAKSNDASLRQLLEDLELILLEISNQGDDPESVQAVKQILAEQDILFKMNVIEKKNERSNISTI